MLTLLHFGLEHAAQGEGDINRVQFWRSVKASCDQLLAQGNADTETTLEIISLMKEAGILTNKAMRIAAQLINNINELSTSQLTEFTIIYSSP